MDRNFKTKKTKYNVKHVRTESCRKWTDRAILLNTDTDEPSTYNYEARDRTEKSGFDVHEQKRDFRLPATPYPVFVTVGTRGSLCGGSAVRA
jgi:hypothetical protein